MIDAIGFKIRPDMIPRQTTRAKMFLETSVKMHRKIGNYMCLIAIRLRRGNWMPPEPFLAAR